jgi:hypothetical protein
MSEIVGFRNAGDARRMAAAVGRFVASEGAADPNRAIAEQVEIVENLGGQDAGVGTTGRMMVWSSAEGKAEEGDPVRVLEQPLGRFVGYDEDDTPIFVTAPAGVEVKVTGEIASGMYPAVRTLRNPATLLYADGSGELRAVPVGGGTLQTGRRYHGRIIGKVTISSTEYDLAEVVGDANPTAFSGAAETAWAGGLVSADEQSFKGEKFFRDTLTVSSNVFNDYIELNPVPCKLTLQVAGDTGLPPPFDKRGVTWLTPAGIGSPVFWSQLPGDYLAVGIGFSNEDLSKFGYSGTVVGMGRSVGSTLLMDNGSVTLGFKCRSNGGFAVQRPGDTGGYPGWRDGIDLNIQVGSRFLEFRGGILVSDSTVPPPPGPIPPPPPASAGLDISAPAFPDATITVSNGLTTTSYPLDGDGLATISDLFPYGTYTVTLEGAAYWESETDPGGVVDSFANDTATITFSGADTGGTVEFFDEVPPDGYSVEGFALDLITSLPAGTTIALYDGATLVDTVSVAGGDGSFVFSNVPDGTYTMEIPGSDYLPAGPFVVSGVNLDVGTVYFSEPM